MLAVSPRGHLPSLRRTAFQNPAKEEEVTTALGKPWARRPRSGLLCGSPDPLPLGCAGMEVGVGFYPLPGRLCPDAATYLWN